jgi:plasmid stabilization system protein ParE
MVQIELVWLSKALLQIEEHYNFAAKGSEKAANELIQILFNTADVLKTFPYAGSIEPLLEEMPISFRSLVADKNHKLIYTVTGNIVEIHAVWDCRQSEEVLKQTIKTMK